MKVFYSVDIADDCKGQEFIVNRVPCFITGNPVILVSGMGLSQSYMDNGETDDTVIRGLLATVDCVPQGIRQCAGR